MFPVETWECISWEFMFCVYAWRFVCEGIVVNGICTKLNL